MQDRIEEALENSSEGGEDYPEQDRMEAKEKARYREDNEDRKTVKIEMGRQKPPLSHGTARSGDITGRSTGDIEKGDSGQNATANSSLKSKLNLHNRKKQVQDSHNVKQELPSSSFTAHTGHSLQPQTSAFASTNSAQTPLPANKTAPQEFQVFIEVETGYSFWAFLCSPSIQLWKKLSNIFFFIIFILSLVFSILDLVVYTESSCSLSALTTIVYFIYFILAALLKISFYIFLQLEIHGKIQYSWKVVAGLTI